MCAEEPNHRRDLKALFERTAPEAPPLDIPGLVSMAKRREIRPTVMLLAAAASLLLALVGWFFLLANLDANHAFAAVQESLRSVKSITLTLTVRTTDPMGGAQSEEVQKVMLLGADLGRYDKANGDYVIFDRNRGEPMAVIRSEKTVLRMKTPEEGQFPVPNLLDRLCNLPAEAVRELPDRAIDGRQAIGFVLVADEKGAETKVWVDPQTMLAIRVEFTRQFKIENWRVQTAVLDDFEYDTELAPSLFKIEVPPGYAVEGHELR